MPPSNEHAPSAEHPPFSINDIIIRGVRLSDAEAITDIANMPGVRNGTLRQPFQSIETTVKFIETSLASGLHLAAEWNGALIGSANLHRMTGRRHHAAILGMGIHDGFTGKGVGTALLTALIGTSDNWHDIRRIELTVFSDNDAAIRLYEKFGFEHEGRCREFAFRNGVYADALTMARLRHSGSASRT
jgi:putative acetyltransferase